MILLFLFFLVLDTPNDLSRVPAVTACSSTVSEAYPTGCIQGSTDLSPYFSSHLSSPLKLFLKGFWGTLGVLWIPFLFHQRAILFELEDKFLSPSLSPHSLFLLFSYFLFCCCFCDSHSKNLPPGVSESTLAALLMVQVCGSPPPHGRHSNPPL